MTEQAALGPWHEAWRLPLPHSRRGRVLVAIRLAALVALVAIAVMTPGFFTAVSLFSLLNTTSFIGCVAVGMTFITLSGNIMSFALGVTLSTSGIVFIAALPLGLPAALLVAFAYGAAITGLQGAAIGYFRANPIIVSMAALALITGGATLITQGQGVYPQGEAAAALKERILRVPMPLAAFIFTVVVAQIVLSFTRFGRHLYMVGSNWRAALAAGLEPARIVLGAYVAAGLCTAFAGILMAARYSSGDLELGLGYDYSAISAVLVGGTAISGGEGSAIRSLIGAFIIAICQVLLLLHGFSTQIQYLAIGVIVLVRDHAANARRRPLNRQMRALLANRSVRPYLLLVAITVVLWLLDGGRGQFLTTSTAFSVLQQFATIGPIALGLGLSMIIREIDLSVGGMLSLSGCIAVLTGAQLSGARRGAGGAFRARLGIVPGRDHGLAAARLDRRDARRIVDAWRSRLCRHRQPVDQLSAYGRRARGQQSDAVHLFAAQPDCACRFPDRRVFHGAHPRRPRRLRDRQRQPRRHGGGRAHLSDPAGVFACSGMLAALGGALLSYSLAAASGVALTDALVPAIAAAIIGGVSLTGGKGTPIGIVGGVLVLCLLSAGLNAVGTPPAVQDVVTGVVLFVVAIADAVDLDPRLFAIRRYWTEVFVRRAVP